MHRSTHWHNKSNQSHLNQTRLNLRKSLQQNLSCECLQHPETCLDQRLHPNSSCWCYPDQNSSKNHVVDIGEEDTMEVILTCTICQNTFQHSHQLEENMEALHDSKCSTPYTCNFCDEGFSSTNTLKTHLATIHPSGYLPCSKCMLLLSKPRSSSQ